MKLDEFITQTLISVTKGLLNANSQLKAMKPENIGYDNFFVSKLGTTADNNYILFDVAVYSSKEIKGDVSGHGEILVASLDVEVEGKYDFAKTSRVSFKVKCGA